MIDNKSFELYTQLVKDNKYNNLFDITIIYQVSETLNNEYLELEEKDFKSLCYLVKKDYLKYDIELNDNLVMNCFDKMERLETGTYTNSNELKEIKDNLDKQELLNNNDNLSYKQMITELIETEYQGYENSSEYKNIMANIDNITINVLPKINSDLTIEEELDIVWKEINKYEIESEI